MFAPAFVFYFVVALIVTAAHPVETALVLVTYAVWMRLR